MYIWIESTASDYIAIASRFFNKEFPHPKITLDQRGKIAGTARLQDWHIRLNPVLLQDNPEIFRKEVIPHEIAHLIVYAVWGKVKPHGKEWQSVMQNLFGIRAQTTHSMDVSKVRGEMFSYRCHCQTHQLSIRRHRAIQRGERQYKCRKCGEVLISLSD